MSNPEIFQGRRHTKKTHSRTNIKIAKITGKLLFYAKAINPTILTTLGTITAAQTSGTIETEKAAQKLIDYYATHPDATLHYKTSGMILKAHSDASYFTESKASI